MWRLNPSQRDARSCVEATLAAIDAREAEVRALLGEPGRIDRLGPDPRPDRLRRDADALERRWPDPAARPALYGIPVGVKDLFRVDGFPTRAGSTLPPEAFEGGEASVITRLRGAGAILVAKTTTDEFAYSEPPPTRNPRDLTRTPGGSSAGSAAGVASGMFPLALGTQTSRSIIAPAAFCGVVGYKPSHGRVPIDGVIPLSPSMDTVGCLAADTGIVRWAASILVEDWRAMSHGGAPAPDHPVVPRPLPVFGVPDGLYLDSLPREGWYEPFRRSIGTLADARATIVRSALPWDDILESMYSHAMTLLHGEMVRVHGDWWPRYGYLYRERTRNGIEHGRKFSDTEIEHARTEGLRLRERIRAWLDERDIDFLLSPSQPEPAPLLGTRTGWGSTTTPWSFAGLPCVSIPAGTLDGLPVGLQMVGKHGEDEELVAAAAIVESLFAART